MTGWGGELELVARVLHRHGNFQQPKKGSESLSFPSLYCIRTALLSIDIKRRQKSFKINNFVNSRKEKDNTHRLWCAIMAMQWNLRTLPGFIIIYWLYFQSLNFANSFQNRKLMLMNAITFTLLLSLNISFRWSLSALLVMRNWTSSRFLCIPILIKCCYLRIPSIQIIGKRLSCRMIRDMLTCWLLWEMLL